MAVSRPTTSLPPPPPPSHPLSKLQPKFSDICIEEIGLWPSEPLSAAPPPPPQSLQGLQGPPPPKVTFPPALVPTLCVMSRTVHHRPCVSDTVALCGACGGCRCVRVSAEPPPTALRRAGVMQ